MAKEKFSLVVHQHDFGVYEVTSHWGGGDVDEITALSIAVASYLNIVLNKPVPGLSHSRLVVDVLATAVEMVKIENPKFASELRQLAISMVKKKNS